MRTAGKVGIAVAALLAAGWFGLSRSGSDARSAPSRGAEPAPPDAERNPEPAPDLAAAPRSAKGRSGPTRPVSAAPGTHARAEVAASPVMAANQRTTPGDVVEILLLGSAAPMEYTLILELDRPKQASPSAEPLPTPDLRVVSVGSDGIARLTGIQAGKYSIRVCGPGGFDRTLVAAGQLPVGPIGNYVFPVVVGEGAVRGRLFDRDGTPVRGALVTLSAEAWATLGWQSVATQTDEDGRYAFPGLHSGLYRLAAVLGAPSELDARVDAFTLAAGEAKVIDLGSSRPEPRWSGTARLVSGTLLHAPTRIFLSEAVRGTPALWVPIDERGAFSARVPRGEYRGRIDFCLVKYGFPVTLGDSDLSDELVIPGVRVSGVLRIDRSGAATSTTGPGVTAHRVRIRFVDVAFSDARDSGEAPDAKGNFAFDAVPPGLYRILATPPPASPFGEVSLLVEVGEAHDVSGLVLEAPAK